MVMSDTQPLESVLDQADNVAKENGTADLRTLIESFDDRAFGPVLTLLGLLSLSPVGAIPGVPIILGAVVVLFAGQILFGEKTPWLPGFVGKISVKEEKIAHLQDKAEGWLARIDGLIRPRIELATGSVARRLAAGIVIALGFLMMPLEAIPFAVAIPAIGITLFGIGLTARDGLVMLCAFAASAVAAAGIWFVV